MPCPAMRGSLRFMPEGSGEFEVVGHAGTVRRRWCLGGAERTASATCRRVHTVAKQLRRQLGDDADHPTHNLTEPCFGYQMAKGGRAGQEAM